MFDRGLIGFADDLSILVHRKVNDRDSVEAVINKTGRLLPPAIEAHHPHPQFLSWHREFTASTARPSNSRAVRKLDPGSRLTEPLVSALG